MLREAMEVTVRPAPEEIDGHACRVLDFDILSSASAPSGTVPHKTWASIWIDTERSYRPLRIEHYIDNGGKQLNMVISRVRLENVTGMWVPVSGIESFYRRNYVIEDGYTMEQLDKMPQQEALKHVRFEDVLNKDSLREISASSWRTGAEVDDALFAFEFPQGTQVWDEARYRRYTVGSPDADVVPGTISLSKDPTFVPERLSVFIDSTAPVTSKVYVFTRLVEPQFKLVSAACDIEGVAAAVEKPDENGLRNTVTLTAAPAGAPGRRYGLLRLRGEPDDFGEMQVHVMVREAASGER